MSALTRIGLIGGVSWESTSTYYNLLNRAVRKQIGGSASAPVTVWSMDFADITALQEQGDWPAQGRLLADVARRLESAGVQAIAVAANTLHLVADDIRAAITVPFVDMIDLARDAVHARGFDRIGLLATGYTMRSDLFSARFAPDVDVLVPDDAGQKIVHDVIYAELTRGIVRDESRQAYVAEIAKLAAAGAQAVILGCTEIGMLLRDGDADLPLIDTTSLHVDALVDVIINGVAS